MAIYKKLLNVGLPLTNNISSLFQRNNFLNHQLCATIRLRTLEKQLGLPSKPKRPLTPFFRFLRINRPSFLKQHPNVSTTELTKIMAENWRTIDSNEKEKMQAEFQEDLQEYTKQLMIYDKNLSEEQKTLLKTERARRVDTEKKLKQKLKLQELGRPKKPPTAFVHYMLSKIHTRSKEINFSNWLSNVAKEWASLPSESKLMHQNETRKLMEQYKKEMVIWEDKMFKLGHINVIRKQVLLDLKDNDSKSKVNNDSS